MPVVRKKWIVIGVLCAVFAPAAFAAPSNHKQIAEGQAIATDACSACHQVTRGQKRPAPVPDPHESVLVAAPSFMEIAVNHGSDKAYLRAAILRPHYPMREQDWLEGDLRAVIAYIQSLRPVTRQRHEQAPSKTGH
jgi:mono/diheme cytochrome c family protein